MKTRAHQHEYLQHPSWVTHYCCRVCGFAAPKSLVDPMLAERQKEEDRGAANALAGAVNAGTLSLEVAHASIRKESRYGLVRREGGRVIVVFVPE